MSLAAGFRHPAFLSQCAQALGGVIIAFLALVIWMGLTGEAAKQALIDQVPSETVIVQHTGASSGDHTPQEALPHAEEPAHHQSSPAAHHEEKPAEGHHAPAPENGHEDLTEHVTPPAPASSGHEAGHAPEQDGHHADATEPPHISLTQPGLTEDTAFGKLPIIRAGDGMTPFDAYKVVFTPPPAKFKFSLIIRDMGLSAAHTEQVIASLPPYVTLAFSPYAAASGALLQQAQEKKQEVWLALPLENKDPLLNDTGPLSLRADFNSAANKDALHAVLGHLDAYAGLIGLDTDHSSVQLNGPGFETVLKDIFARGLGFAYQSKAASLDIAQAARTDAGTALHIAEDFALPFAQLAPQLDAALKAHRNVSVAVNLYPADIAHLTTWLNDLPGKGYVLAPLSAQK